MNIIQPAYKWNSELKKRVETKFIIVHHAESAKCTVEDIHKWHIENGWAGIGYNFFIRKDGTTYQGRPIDVVGVHTVGYNETSVGVCLEGNYDMEYIPTVQADALVELLIDLQKQYHGARVTKHGTVNATKCPGKNFDDKLLLKSMEKRQPEHWAEKEFKYLNDNGIKISERRFDDEISRAECMAMMSRLHKSLKG